MAVAEVDLSINGHRYGVSCGDGEEDALHHLAAEVDRRMRNLHSAVGGGASETHLLLLTALVLTDELAEAQRAPAAPQASGAPPASADDAACERVDALSARVSALTARLSALSRRGT